MYIYIHMSLNIKKESMYIITYVRKYLCNIHIYINGLHVLTRSSICLVDDEDGSSHPRERVGVIKINQDFVCIDVYLHTYIYIIYMRLNAHTCTHRILHVPCR